MPSWNDLLTEFEAQGNSEKFPWIERRLTGALAEIGRLRGDRHVVLYGSGFLQKPTIPSTHVMITYEDLNAFMSVIYGMDWDKGLTLVLHTPGGVTNAAETLVAYLRSKFADVEVIVPAYAMSAGTMISLACERIVLGRQSQLGPIDPQMTGGGGSVSARSVVDQFLRARSEVMGDVNAAHVWAPILASLGPALLQEAQNAIGYSERMVANWLSSYMFAGRPSANADGAKVASYFNDASNHMSHGRRIDRDEARQQGVVIENLEDSQLLQEAVLTAYHIFTITVEQSPVTKMLWSDHGRTWVKNWGDPASPQDATPVETASP